MREIWRPIARCTVSSGIPLARIWERLLDEHGAQVESTVRHLVAGVKRDALGHRGRYDWRRRIFPNREAEVDFGGVRRVHRRTGSYCRFAHVRVTVVMFWAGIPRGLSRSRRPRRSWTVHVRLIARVRRGTRQDPVRIWRATYSYYSEILVMCPAGASWCLGGPWSGGQLRGRPHGSITF